MTKTLAVGDPHVREIDIPECERLIDLIERSAQEYECDTILFLGDQTHNHSLLHVDVMAFWNKAFRRLCGSPGNYKFDVIAIVGNHDFASTGSGHHAMEAYRDIAGLCVVDCPVYLDENTFCLPWYKDNAEFVRVCRENSNYKRLICHQEFDTAELASGFYSTNGVKLKDIPQTDIISGHIHRSQVIQNENQTLVYVGSPRWLNLADANIEKRLVVYENDVPIATIDTSVACSKIEILEDTVAQPLSDDLAINPLTRYTFDIKGPKEWVAERKAKWGVIGRVRTYVDREESIKVKESAGIMTAFGEYFRHFSPPNKTDKNVLQTMFMERFA